MLKAEAARPDGIEVVSIVTPNHVHYEQSAACLEAGLDVICDKPRPPTWPMPRSW
jgi:predicted dehydrogenase